MNARRTANALEVVFEDDMLIAFNKPSGLLIAPDRWDKSLPNLMRMVHEELSPAYFNAHRLDRDTGGLVLCAKTKPALDDLCRQFEARTVRKEYAALVEGAPAKTEGVVREQLAPDRSQPGRMRLTSRGRMAETRFRIAERFRHHTLLLLEPVTGRTHQLRLHAVCLGCPILGDALYGHGPGLFLSTLKARFKPGRHEERPLIAHLALHAAKLTFRHPGTGAETTISTPLPREMEVALRNLRRFAPG